MTTMTDKKVLYTASTHHRWTLGSGPQFGRTARCEVVGARVNRPGHESRAAVCCRLVGVLRRGDGRRGTRNEDQAADDLAIDTEVDLNLADGEYSRAARMNISVPGVDRAIAQQLVDAAEKSCPYSKAIRGNIPATFNLV